MEGLVPIPVRRRRRHLQRTREDILEATFQVVSQFGYPGSRIEDICSRARVSRGAFYHHFPSKEAAIVALIERNLETVLEESRRIEQLAAGDPVRRIALEIAAVLRWVATAAPVSRAYLVEMVGVPEARELRDRIERWFVEQIWTTVQPQFASGELHSGDPVTTFRSLAGMTRETAAAWTLGLVPDLSRAIGEVVRLALMGIGVPAERAQALADEAAEHEPVW